MLPSARDGEDPQEQLPSPRAVSAPGQISESLWAGSARTLEGTAEGFNASWRAKGCREVGPSLRLSWSVPGAWGRTWGGCRGGSRAAAIQLSTAFSHRGKARLLKASNRVASRGQIQAAKQKGVCWHPLFPMGVRMGWCGGSNHVRRNHGRGAGTPHPAHPEQ